MDLVAATGSITRTTKRRERRSEAVQGDGEKICDVEAERHVGFDEGVEDGNNRGGEEAI